MYKIVILLFVYFAFPLVIIYMTRRWSLFRKIGSIALAYAFGLIFGTSGILPQGSEAYRFALQGELSLTKAEMETLLSKGTVSKDDLFINTIAVIQENLLNVTVLLAFPLLLFSLNFRKWLKFAKEGLISMILALVSILAIIASGYFIFRDVVPDSWKVAGMLVGVYTGGTPNMASLKVALDVDPSLFLMTSTYDIIVGAATLIFFITAGPRVFRAFLPPFKREGININTDEAVAEEEGFEDFSGMFGKERVLPLLKALGISVLILALSVGLSLLAPKEFENVIVILSVTTLAVMASFIKWLNRTEKTFQFGMYFIIVFSFAVASKSDLRVIFDIGYLGLFAFVLYVYFGSLLLHLLLAKIFKVNADDYLITTTAFIYSPPFVPVVAAAMKNKDVIITGITVGIFGYVIGNYLGPLIAYFLKGF
ncbi:MAG TPA: DUF819 family protein [Bacteroidales bacterium]|nr:DUF819 family protein [Bacteroidales bacterium]